MKKLIFMVAIAMGSMTPMMAQTQKDPEWAIELGISKAWLIDQKLAAHPDEKIKDNFDLKSTTIDIRGLRRVSDTVQVGIGFGMADFDAKTVPFDFFGLASSYSFDDIETMTYYATAQFSQRNGAWEPFAAVELGVASVEDCDMTFNFPGFGSGKAKIYKGGSNLYWSLGFGLKHHFNNNVYMGLAYKFKDYGKLDANAVSSSLGIKDLELKTNNLELMLGVKF